MADQTLKRVVFREGPGGPLLIEDFNSVCKCETLPYPDPKCHHWVSTCTSPQGEQLKECFTHSGFNPSGAFKTQEIVSAGVTAIIFADGRCLDTCTTTPIDEWDSSPKVKDTWAAKQGPVVDDWEAAYGDDGDLVDDDLDGVPESWMDDLDSDDDAAPALPGTIPKQPRQGKPKTVNVGSYISVPGYSGEVPSFTVFTDHNPDFKPLQLHDSEVLAIVKSFFSGVDIVKKDKKDIYELRRERDSIKMQIEALEREPIAMAQARDIKLKIDTVEREKHQATIRGIEPSAYEPYTLALKAVDQARRKQATWKAGGKRKKLLDRMAEVIVDSQNKTTSVVTFEEGVRTGKTVTEPFSECFNQYIKASPQDRSKWQDHLKLFVEYIPYDKWLNTYYHFVLKRYKDIEARRKIQEANRGGVRKTVIRKVLDPKTGKIIELEEAVTIKTVGAYTATPAPTAKTPSPAKTAVRDPSPSKGRGGRNNGRYTRDRRGRSPGKPTPSRGTPGRSPGRGFQRSPGRNPARGSAPIQSQYQVPGQTNTQTKIDDDDDW